MYTIACSTYGLHHDSIEPTDTFGLPLTETLLPQELKKAGYDTFMVGKWHLGFFAWEYTPTFRGFDKFYGYYNVCFFCFFSFYPCTTQQQQPKENRSGL